jgi:hypothetical protein
MAAAYALMTAGQNDTLYLMGGTTGLTLPAASPMDWNKAYTHLVGVSSGSFLAQRSRIFGNASMVSAYLFRVSATGCSFTNIHWNYGVASSAALVAVHLTSAASRSRFNNCHISGINNATQDAAGACSLKMDGVAECTFDHCAIGSDTQKTRGANSSEILFDTKTSKAFFFDCLIYACISSADHHLVRLADNEGLQDFGAWFKNCTFVATSTNKAVALTEVFDIPSGGVQYILMDNCSTTTTEDTAHTGAIYGSAPTGSKDGGVFAQQSS